MWIGSEPRRRARTRASSARRTTPIGIAGSHRERPERGKGVGGQPLAPFIGPGVCRRRVQVRRGDRVVVFGNRDPTQRVVAPPDTDAINADFSHSAKASSSSDRAFRMSPQASCSSAKAQLVWAIGSGSPSRRAIANASRMRSSSRSRSDSVRIMEQRGRGGVDAMDTRRVVRRLGFGEHALQPVDGLGIAGPEPPGELHDKQLERRLGVPVRPGPLESSPVVRQIGENPTPHGELIRPRTAGRPRPGRSRGDGGGSCRLPPRRLSLSLA